MSLTYQQEIQCRKFAGHLLQLSVIEPLDCNDLHIRSVITALRDIWQYYSKYWKIAGFQEPPLIHSFSWKPNMLTPDVEAIYWGDAKEIPTPGYIIREMYERMGVSIPENREFLDGPVSNGYHFASNNSAYNFTSGQNLPYEETEVKISRFFDAPIVFWHGKILKRADIIEYAAYELGFIHTEYKNYDSKHKHQKEVLESINNSPNCFRRNNILYMVLGIARNIIEADCTKKYLQKFS